MAYDEVLANRIGVILKDQPNVNEKKMFGGVAYMVNGNMCFGATEAGIIVRVGPEAYEEALALPHAGVMDFTGRPMRGWIHVESEGLASDEELHDWMTRGMRFAATLPAKCSQATRAPTDTLSPSTPQRSPKWPSTSA